VHLAALADDDPTYPRVGGPVASMVEAGVAEEAARPIHSMNFSPALAPEGVTQPYDFSFCLHFILLK